MVARFTGAGLGLLAFAITATSGLLVGNPIEVTLSRSILALILFCVLGLLIGGTAHCVIAEHQRQSEAAIREQYRVKSAEADRTPKDGVETSEGETIDA